MSDNKQQLKDFEKTAKELDCDQSPGAFDKALGGLRLRQKGVKKSSKKDKK